MFQIVCVKYRLVTDKQIIPLTLFSHSGNPLCTSFAIFVRSMKIVWCQPKNEKHVRG